MTLPGAALPRVGCIPVTLTQQRIEGLFRSLGLTSKDGPEIETDFHNFEAAEHPGGSPRTCDGTGYVLWKMAMYCALHTSPILDGAALHVQPCR